MYNISNPMRNDNLLWEFKTMSPFDISEGPCNVKKEMGRNIFGFEIEDSKLQQRDNGRLGITWFEEIN